MAMSDSTNQFCLGLSIGDGALGLAPPPPSCLVPLYKKKEEKEKENKRESIGANPEPLGKHMSTASCPRVIKLQTLPESD
eukprot:326498-Rhodomonas_salina.1